ncbi:hypothetical protein GCM10010437_049810 [Actinoplanes palleronii]
MTLWGRKRIRTVLATVVASAAGLVPGVFVATPAFAAAADNLTITSAANWEGGDLVFKLTYTGNVPASFGITTGGGTATGSAAFNMTDGTTDYDNDAFTTPVTFLASSASSPSTATITIPTKIDTDSVDETFTVTATNSALNGGAGDSSVETATGTIWAWSSNDITLGGSTKVVESTKTVTVTAQSTYPQAHDVVIPVKTADPSRAALSAGNYMTTWARSTGGDFRDFTALASDAVITIPANQTTGSTTVSINDDTADETDTQYFDVAVDTGRAVLGGARVSGQDVVEMALTDNDDKPTLSIADSVSAKEGTRLSFPVSLSNPSETATTFDFTSAGAVSGNTPAATNGTDFTNESAISKTIPQYGKLVNVPVTTLVAPASTWEGPENVRATIANASSNATLGTAASANGTITDAEAGQTVEYSAETPFNAGSDTWTEGSNGPTDKIIYVKFASDSPLPATLSYSFVDGTAKNGVDYVGKSGSITIPAGSDGSDGTKALQIPVSIIGDRIAEDDETFKLHVTSTSGVADDASLGDLTFIIDDDDSAPIWTTADATVQEGNSGTTLARVPIKLSSAAGTDATFTATIADVSAVEAGTAAGSNDYDLPKSLTATIKAGETTGYFEVPVNGDAVYERDETFTVTFVGSGNVGTTGDSVTQSRVTIGNDDQQPKLTFATASGTEGGTVTVAPTVVGQSQYQYDIGFTAGSTGTDPATVGSDFEIPTGLASAIATVPVGYEGALSKMTVPFTLPAFNLLNDDIDEPVETFSVTANEVSSVLKGFTTSTAIVKIADDPLDTPPAASVADVSSNEKDGWAMVPVDLAFTGEATSTTQTVTIPWWTENGTAMAGKDYTMSKGTLSVPPGTMKASIKVPLIDDKAKEDNETFTVRLGNPGPLGASVINGDSTVTIKSDDAASVTPTLMLSGPAKGVGGVTAWGKAAPGSVVELWGAPLPTTDPTKTKWLANVTANSSGEYKFGARQISQGWTFVVRSEEVNSAVKMVKLTQAPALTATSTKGKLNVMVAGNPKATGQTVTIQRWTGGKWVTLASGKTTSTGYKGSWSFKSKTKLTVRAMVSGNSGMGINSGYSASKAVTIK